MGGYLLLYKYASIQQLAIFFFSRFSTFPAAPTLYLSSPEKLTTERQEREILSTFHRIGCLARSCSPTHSQPEEVGQRKAVCVVLKFFSRISSIPSNRLWCIKNVTSGPGDILRCENVDMLIFVMNVAILNAQSFKNEP